ncbi:DGQHR domain-containing protein [Pedobacter sp. MR2016-19]|uniref:DGQHR domain-containing protein n=1 Tax=Pedobacter sp. MR2016-19 TaxID=2780089 RepID=UPI0018746D2B|nr:DGQHR domain-containing protein [Pedobacter sp. MR2016-19]MBE5320033.1 DGQHR domain-containing protein [Pedobacter sp. MR2016-19]
MENNNQNSTGSILINAKKVIQNNQEFYLGIFTIKHILSFTKYTERLIVNYDENNKPIYNKQIQRKVDKSRVEKIVNFLLDDPDAIFPTNLVIALPNAVIELFEEDANSNNTHITLSPKVSSELTKDEGDVFLTIIDGQHRINGIEAAFARLTKEISDISKIVSTSNNVLLQKNLEAKTKLLKNLQNIQLPVTFFIDPTLEFQAMIFSTINRTQKSVPQSLVYSLFGLTSEDSPQKTALQTVLTLNSFEKSPFYNRIKLYGGKYDRNQSPPLTQAGMVKSIIDLISANLTESERDRFKPRQDLKKGCNDDLPFRKYYANNRDNYILDILFSFFAAVRQVFVSDEISIWDLDENSTKPENILHTTVGYQALISIMVDILKEVKDDNQRDKISIYKGYLIRAKHLNFADARRYPYTGRSKRVLYFDMSLKIWPAINQDDERIAKLTELLNEN